MRLRGSDGFVDKTTGKKEGWNDLSIDDDGGEIGIDDGNKFNQRDVGNALKSSCGVLVGKLLRRLGRWVWVNNVNESSDEGERVGTVESPEDWTNVENSSDALDDFNEGSEDKV